jgi:hypothetical protein
MRWYDWKLGSFAWTYLDDRAKHSMFDGDGEWQRLCFGLWMLSALPPAGKGRVIA